MKHRRHHDHYVDRTCMRIYAIGEGRGGVVKTRSPLITMSCIPVCCAFPLKAITTQYEGLPMFCS